MNAYKIAQFLIDNGLYSQMRYTGLAEAIKGHIKHKTLLVIGDIDAVARWNMDTTDVAYVIDVAVSKDKRFLKYLKLLIQKGMKRFPRTKYLRFERGLKGKKMKLVKVSRFLKEK